MTEDHEEAGYEYEKGRQKFLDEQEEKRQIRASQNWGTGRKKCCKGFRRVILAAISFFIFGAIAFYILFGVLEQNAVGSKGKGIDPNSIQGIALLIFVFMTAFVLPAVLAFIGAMNMLSGCLIGLSDD